jgi:hypothetical protein
MKPQRTLIIIFLALGVTGLGGLTWQQSQGINLLEQELKDAKSEIERLQAELKSAQARRQRPNLEASSATARPEMGPADMGPPDLAAGEAGPGRQFMGRMNAFRELEKNPEFQKLMQIEGRAQVEGRYSDLFKKLQLPPGALEAFKGLLQDKQNAVRDTMEVAREKGLTGPDNRDQLRALVQSTQAEIDSSIRSTIGDAAYDQYKSYEATSPQRSVASSLSQRLSYTSTPLSDDQSTQLVQAMLGSKTTGRTMGMGGSAQITDSTISQAQGFLSAPQVQALQQLQAEQQAQQQARQMLQKQRTSAPAPQGGGQAPRPGG